MTREQALQCLNLDEGASATDLRKAYLRLIKRHKPESDPEGFARIRAAYDFLRKSDRDPGPSTPIEPQASERTPPEPELPLTQSKRRAPTAVARRMARPVESVGDDAESKSDDVDRVRAALADTGPLPADFGVDTVLQLGIGGRLRLAAKLWSRWQEEQALRGEALRMSSADRVQSILIDEWLALRGLPPPLAAAVGRAIASGQLGDANQAMTNYGMGHDLEQSERLIAHLRHLAPTLAQSYIPALEEGRMAVAAEEEAIEEARQGCGPGTLLICAMAGLLASLVAAL